eukprot:354846-Chlamydomonas_euryale.AAC.3
MAHPPRMPATSSSRCCSAPCGSTDREPRAWPGAHDAQSAPAIRRPKCRPGTCSMHAGPMACETQRIAWTSGMCQLSMHHAVFGSLALACEPKT